MAPDITEPLKASA